MTISWWEKVKRYFNGNKKTLLSPPKPDWEKFFREIEKRFEVRNSRIIRLEKKVATLEEFVKCAVTYSELKRYLVEYGNNIVEEIPWGEYAKEAVESASEEIDWNSCAEDAMKELELEDYLDTTDIIKEAMERWLSDNSFRIEIE